MNFNECKNKDFTKRGLDLENIPKYDDLSIMICPDFDTYPELVKIFNNYNNHDRDALSIQINDCD